MPFIAPPFPTVIEGLVRAIFLGRVSPPQAIAIDEYNATQDAPVINAELAVGLREVGFKTRHLHVGQPEKVAHITARFSNGESRSRPEINGS
jgi:hypothetical protein